MKSSLVALNLTLLICLLTLILVSGEERISEREILLQFRGSVADPSGMLSGWSSNGSHHCSWFGVTCDSDSRVIAINVTGCQDRGKVGSFYRFGSRKACQFVQGALGGKLSPLIGELTQLRILSLAWNKLDGEIPLEIWDLERLEILDLEGNCFGGKLPSQFIGLRKLKILSLGFNKIEGNISMSLSQCVDLEVLSLAGNMFNGLFPEFLGRFAKIKVVSLSSNMLNGSIPENIGGNCSYLEHLDLSNNLLSGKLPDSLGHCWRLKTLLLSSNMLSGVIPKQLGLLPDLDVVDISGNDLSGSIPGNLIKWRYLTALVCNNNRSLVEVQSLPNKMTPLPDVPSRKLSDEFAPNSSDGVQYADSPTNFSSLNKSLNAVEVASIVSASAIVSLLLVLLVIFIYTRKRGPKSKKNVYGSMEIVIFVDIGIPLTYENVVEATGNFSANNCIGHGGFGATYKAEIAPGTLVAVKRLSVGRFQGVKQFDAEIRTLGTARHPNLVKLIGYHASEKEMFLIYNYLPGGNLENFIKERTTKVVEWKTIYRIALDIANALAYLHHQCTPKILHRDVKPSNILLDNELNASLSDFGLSRLLGPSETHATTSVAGTFGYVAPEYAMTCRVSEKADVYSYGIVLLELISDKKALDPSFSSEADGFNIVSWASMLLQQGQGRDVFSSNLREVSPHESLIEMLHLAIKCTVDSLSTRPTMKQVVQQLRRIQPL